MHGGIFGRCAGLLLLATLLGGPRSVSAQQYGGRAAAPRSEGATYDIQLTSTNALYLDLDSRLTAVENILAEQEADQGPEPVWEDTSKQKLSVQFGGRVYGDVVTFAHQDSSSHDAYGDLENFWEFRRIRFYGQGQGYGVFDYKVQLEYEPEVIDDSVPLRFGSVGMRDIYIGVHEIPWFGYLRFGNFKEPIGLEEINSSKYITFMERAMPITAFTPERHVGLCAFNHTHDEQFTIAYGAFFNDSGEKSLAKQRIDDDQGIDLPIRVTWNPIYSAGGRGVLHLGLGYVWSDVRGDRLTISTRPEVHEESVFITTGARPVDNWHRLNTEVATVYGPFSVQSELFYAHTNEIGAGNVDQDFYGGYLYGSWFLTGEHRPYKRTAAVFDGVKPHTNFWLVRTCDQSVDCGWGAWELGLRWSFIDLDGPGIEPQLPGVGAGTVNDLTLGVNWYWNPNMRVMFNYIHSWSVLNTIPDEVANTDILAMRMQVHF